MTTDIKFAVDRIKHVVPGYSINPATVYLFHGCLHTCGDLLMIPTHSLNALKSLFPDLSKVIFIETSTYETDYWQGYYSPIPKEITILRLDTNFLVNENGYKVNLISTQNLDLVSSLIRPAFNIYVTLLIQQELKALDPEIDMILQLQRCDDSAIHLPHDIVRQSRLPASCSYFVFALSI